MLRRGRPLIYRQPIRPAYQHGSGVMGFIGSLGSTVNRLEVGQHAWRGCGKHHPAWDGGATGDRSDPQGLMANATSAAQDFDNLDPMRRLEAALLISKEAVGTRRLADLAGLADATEARTLIAQLNQFYDTRGRSFHVKNVSGGYLLMTRPAFSKWIRRLEHVPQTVRLSTPAMETLSVLAYRQPMVRAEIDGIRGVNSGEILRQLMERDLVRICGRSEDLGRPFLYATTRHFLKMFGLGSLDELPEARRLRRSLISGDSPILVDSQQGLVEEIPKD